jgi:putative transposase
LLDHPWSSLAHHLGIRRDPLVTDHAAFWQLGNTPFEREAAYRSWLEQGIGNDEVQVLTDSMLKGRVLGSLAFIARLTEATQRDLVIRPRGRPRRAVTPQESVPNK